MTWRSGGNPWWEEATLVPVDCALRVAAVRAPLDWEGEREVVGAEGLRLWKAREAPWRAAGEVMLEVVVL